MKVIVKSNETDEMDIYDGVIKIIQNCDFIDVYSKDGKICVLDAKSHTLII